MKMIYQMTPEEIDNFIKLVRKEKPNLRERVVAIARRNLGQRYKIYLLGEFPFEIFDSDPLFSIKRGDCVVFSEHIYAMALAYDWRSFFALLQRIRYKNGEISLFTRNHHTLSDWNTNNSWLFKDISEELAGKKSKILIQKVNRSAFFKNRYNLKTKISLQVYKTKYIPADITGRVLNNLKDGDFVNVIRGIKGKDKYCGHVGLIGIGDTGTINFIHSTSPKSIEQPLIEYMNNQLALNKENIKKKKPLFWGFKFFRLREEPLKELLKIDGPGAPIVTASKGLIREMFKLSKK